MKIETAGRQMCVYLSGEVDHHTAGQMRQRTDETLYRVRPAELVIDFSEVSFMDSSGVGFVMGRYKRAAGIGCKTAVRGLTKRDERIMRLSGLAALVEFKNG